MKNTNAENSTEKIQKNYEFSEIRNEIVNCKKVIRQLEEAEPRNIAEINRYKSRLQSFEQMVLTNSKLSSPPNQDVDIQNDLEIIKHFIRRNNNNCFEENGYFPRVKAIKEFENFIQSKNNILILLGNAGVGKSAFINNLILSNKKNNRFYLYINLENFNTSNSQDYESLFSDGIKLQSSLDDLFNKRSTSDELIIFFDTLNKFADKDNFIKKILLFLNSLTGERVKIVLACRSFVWEQIKGNYHITPGKEYKPSGEACFSINRFDLEEREKAFEHFAFKTNYSELSNAVKELLSDPLLLVMTAKSKKGKEVPNDLNLRDVFSDYIENALGKEGYESIEYQILSEVIRIMYDNAKQEIEKAFITQDIAKKSLLLPDFQAHFENLLEQGLLSEKKIYEIVRKVEFISVTYERIFEYLLAEIILGKFTVNDLLKNLDISQKKSFPNLRFATELALCLSILNGTSGKEMILEIAKINRPETRQFLCDVFQILSNCGCKKNAEEFISILELNNSIDIKVCAVQAAYQLGFEDILIKLALSENPTVRNLACLYIYEIWNHYRKVGKIEDGYRIIHKLQSKIVILHPRVSRLAFKALIIISSYMFVHIVDDSNAISPLIDIYKGLINKLPGITLNDFKSGSTDSIPQLYFFVIEFVSNYVFEITDWENSIGALIDHPFELRQLLDIGDLTTLSNLCNKEKELIQLLSSKSSFSRFVASSLITHQVYFNLENHQLLFDKLFYSNELDVKSRVLAFRAYTLGIVARATSTKQTPSDIITYLYEKLSYFYYQIFSPDITSNLNDEKKEQIDYWKYNLFGIFLLEIEKQKESNSIHGSDIVTFLLDETDFCMPVMLSILLNVLEDIALQNHVRFVLLTIFSDKFMACWESISPNEVLKVISNIRSLYHEEVDEFFRDNILLNKYWEEAKFLTPLPNTKQNHNIGTDLWTIIAISTNIELEKIAGLFLLEIALSDSVQNCLRRFVITTLQILSEPIRVDVAHYEWHLINYKTAGGIEKLNLPPNIMSERQDLHSYYKQLINSCIKKIGKPDLQL